MPDAVSVDTSALDEYAKRLGKALADGAAQEAKRAADGVASDITGGVPRLTGRLANSVAVEVDPQGYAVSYGRDVPYAAKIERRDHTVATAVDRGAASFPAAAEDMAKREAAP